jgi:hypothetical protein
LNVDDGCAAIIPWVSGQSLPTSSVNTRKLEVRGIGGHGPAALKAPPLGTLPAGVPKRGSISLDLNLSGAIHHHF